MLIRDVFSCSLINCISTSLQVGPVIDQAGITKAANAVVEASGNWQLDSSEESMTGDGLIVYESFVCCS